MVIRQDYKFSEDFRGKKILQHCKWNNKKLKHCANNKRYDKETINSRHPTGGVKLLNKTWNLNNFTVVMFIACKKKIEKFEIVLFEITTEVLQWLWFEFFWGNFWSFTMTVTDFFFKPVWLNGWVFVYILSGCGFEFRCSHLTSRYCACFEQGVPWNSGCYRV